MPESFDVFISYKREDQVFAEMLRERLIAWGYTAWMDVYNILAGAYWPDEIDRGLNASQLVIGVMSPCAAASRNVKNEWDWAIVNGKQLLLLMIEPCKVPMNYVSINYIDCVKDQTAGLARLQTALTNPTRSTSSIDPYRDYLQALYQRINTYLAQTIIKVRPDDSHTPEPIQLHTERRRGSVDALFEKRDEIDPLFMIGGIRQEPIKLDGDFRTAFGYFDGRVLLLGEPGAGKTITLLHFGRDAVVQRIQDSSRPLPVLALIPTWDAEKQTPLAKWLATVYGAPPAVAKIVAEGRALLLLDGMDELGGKRENLQTKEQYDPRQRFMGIIPANNQIIVTCRVKDYEEIGEKIALEGAVTLQQLTDAQIHDYLSVAVPALCTALEADEELREVARTPLLLSLFAFAYRDHREKAAKLANLQASPVELRDAIFEAYVGKRYEHEERKLKFRHPPEKMPHTLDQIYRVLGIIAIRNVNGGRYIRYSGKGVEEDNVLINEDIGWLLYDRETILSCFNFASTLHLVAPIDVVTSRFIHLLLRDHFAFIVAMQYLDSSDPFCFSAIAALGKLKDKRAVEPLIAMLNNVNGKLREQVVSALGLIGDTRAVEPLLANLSDIDANVRCAIAYALGQIGDTYAVESLIAVLSDVDPQVRSSTAEALGLIGDMRSVRPLIIALRDGESIVRNSSSVALGEIKDVRAVEPLISALGSLEFLDSCASAAFALGQIGDSRAVAPLIDALGFVYDGDSYENRHTRIRAAIALGQIGDTSAVPALLEVLFYENHSELIECAVHALVKIGEPSVKALLPDLQHEYEWRQQRAARALKLIGTPEALTAVDAWQQEQNQE